MDPAEYGPFASLVALASALVAMLGLFVAKMLGRVKKWTWLASDSPPFLVTAGARVLAIAIMALIYVTLDRSNYMWFALVGLLFGVFGFVSISMFERMRREYVVGVPVVTEKGVQVKDGSGRPKVVNVIIGRERDMNTYAKEHFEAARQESGVSLEGFMSGYGREVNNPAALWDRSLLARIGSQLTLALICIVLLAALTLFTAALVIQVATTRPA
jgi:hypothetical protein